MTERYANVAGVELTFSDYFGSIHIETIDGRLSLSPDEARDLAMKLMNVAEIAEEAIRKQPR